MQKSSSGAHLLHEYLSFYGTGSKGRFARRDPETGETKEDETVLQRIKDEAMQRDSIWCQQTAIFSALCATIPQQMAIVHRKKTRNVVPCGYLSHGRT